MGTCDFLYMGMHKMLGINMRALHVCMGTHNLIYLFGMVM